MNNNSGRSTISDPGVNDKIDAAADVPSKTPNDGKPSMFSTMSQQTQVILSILAYSFCSGSLVLVNKLILHHLDYPSLVMTVQLWFTILFIFIAGHGFRLFPVDSLTWSCIQPYLLYTIGFSLGIYSNMRSLQTSTVETVIVFRAMAPLCVSIADALCLGRDWPTPRSWTALGLIVVGAAAYAHVDPHRKQEEEGGGGGGGLAVYTWPTIYLLVISFEMAYGKKIVQSVPLQTLSGPVLYANMLGWPPMILFALAGGEFSKLQHDLAPSSSSASLFTLPALLLLLLGCLVGTGIGYAGWWCRGQVSATSYTVIGVMNKCLTVLVNYCIWDQHAGPNGIAALLVCLLGGSLYQQAPLVADKRKREDEGDEEEANEEAAPLMEQSETQKQ